MRRARLIGTVLIAVLVLAGCGSLTPVTEQGRDIQWLYNILFVAAAVSLGAAFIWRALALRRDLSSRRAVRLFSFSNQYLALLFLAMAVDAVVHVAA